MLIKAGDNVVVISGGDGVKEDDGTRKVRSVIQVDRAAGKALVEGVNMVWKHVRRSQKYPQGGRLKKEMPIDISNVMYYCTSCSKGVRLGARFLDDGSKERFCRKCGTSVGQIAPPRPTHAKK
ncbi:50S ribosomal protein L24 [Aeoliella sp. ICT_H6.2]|uniref:Large ribosomal subunit protein uL24 n=1 Tax=Aeoliella straminimaris TaxID=2954799 RepID=A0A9X2JI17_9BACT|nr:50S ribosomal protein L24 [Aeoliella straminimaris]MCO6046062.1 50S ribosomal protein L24 [Aeoliella straminimaris]